MRSAYISGPMRGIEDFNFPAFDRAEAVLRRAGWELFNPAQMDRDQPVAGDPDSPQVQRKYARRDTDAILSLRAEQGDAIILLEGWEKSRGARAELYFSLWVGLKVYLYVERPEGTYLLPTHFDREGRISYYEDAILLEAT